MRRSLLLLFAFLPLGIPALASAAPTAVPSRPTPLTLASPNAAPSCPSTAELDGTLLNGSMRRMVNRANRASDEDRFIAYLVLGIVTEGEATTIAVCDPDLVAGRQPMGSITGTAVAPPLGDAVGFGLRLRGGPLGGRTAGSTTGDRFVLPPAVGPRATIDLAVHTAGGVRTVRSGPFSAPPVAIRTGGTAAAPVVVTELADGQTASVPVIPLAPVATKLTTWVHGGSRLRVRMRTTPGAFVAVRTPERGDDLRIGGYDDQGDLRVADGKGLVIVEARGLSSTDRRVELSVIDADRRTALTGSCRLTWKRSTLRGARCALEPTSGTRADTTEAARARRTGAASAGGTGTAVRAAIAAVRAHRDFADPRSRRHMASSDVASAARAPSTSALAPITATVVTQLGFESLFGEGESGGLFGDVNGDGRPDFGAGDSVSGTSLLLSQPVGWRSIPLETEEVGDVRAIPDVTGDDTDDFRAEYDPRIISGQRAWATAPPTTVDVRRSTGLGPGDLELDVGTGGSLAEDELPPVPFPDATGDGRPELGIGAPSGSALAIFSSGDLPLGQRTSLPAFLATAVRDDLAALDQIVASLGVDEDAGLPEGITKAANTIAVRGAVAVASTAVTTTITRTGRKTSTALSIHRLDTAAPWSFSSPGPPLELAGTATVVDLDPASGQSLVLSSDEACRRKSGACVVRVRRVDAAGSVVGTVSVRTISYGLTASFADDGPDADTLPEVLILDGEVDSARAAPRPGLDGSVAVWSSTVPVAPLASLPMLGAGGKPYLVVGPLQRWTAPGGARSFAAYVLREKRRELAIAITLLGPLR